MKVCPDSPQVPGAGDGLCQSIKVILGVVEVGRNAH